MADKEYDEFAASCRWPPRCATTGEPLSTADFIAGHSPSIDEIQNNRERLANSAWLLGTVVFILALLLYVATMCRTVFWWDTGELAANARVLGIPHRPGFPLYVIVGRVFGLVPFGEYFYRINFVSALCASLALGFLAYVWHSLFTLLWRPRRWWELALAVVASCTALAGTYTLWMQAVRAEVYAPTLLAVTILLASALGGERAVRRGTGETGRWMCAAGLFGGLGLGLHNATFAAILPAFFIYFILLSRRDHLGWRPWVMTGVLFFIGLSVYLYLPVRASANPALNWGWTSSAHSPGWGAVVGSDALGEVFATKTTMILRHMWDATLLLFGELQWGFMLLSVVGLIALWLKSQRWAILVFLAALGNIVVTALLVSDFSDTNPDIHGYLLPALAMIGLAAAAGILSLAVMFDRLPERIPTLWLRRGVVGACLATLVMLGIAPAAINAPYCNLVSHHLAYDYGTEATSQLEPGAIVFVAGANIDFVLRGLQFCDDWRQDIRVIDRDLMPSAWYRAWLFDKHPELAQIPIPSDSAKLHLGTWARMLKRAGAPVYWEFTETSMDMLYNLIPAGHFFAVSADSVPVIDAQMIRTQEDFERRSAFYNSPKRIRHDFDAQRVYVANLYRAGIFYESRGQYDRARELFQRALSIHSDPSVKRKFGRSSGEGLSQTTSSPPAPGSNFEAQRLDDTAHAR